MIHHILDKRPDCGSKEYIIGRKGCRGSYQRVEDIFWECVTVCTAIIWSKTRGLNLIMGKWFFKWAKAILVIFVLFSTQKTNIVHLTVKWNRCSVCAWDLNQGPQDGRHGRIHWALVASRVVYLFRGAE